jgi:SWI/SNF-related matrix-associated actin-dependent regulator 1 of chromatin subfamily A
VSDVKIALSKKVKGSTKRHVILTVPTMKDPGIRLVIRQYILPKGTVPVSAFRGENTLFKFNISYLDRLLLTFPDAEMSRGLRSRLAKEQSHILDTLDDTEVEVPGFAGELWRFQTQGVNAGIEHLREHGVFMLNDEMGLGKTIQAICMILKLKRKRVLVVTTKSGCGSWAKILRTLFPRVKYEVIEGDASRRAAKANKQVRIRLVNFEALRVQAFDSNGNPWPKKRRESKSDRKVWRPNNPDLFRQRYDMIITDEFHKVKNPHAQQTLGYLQLPKAEMEMPMSGTPFLNNPMELWPVLNRLWPTKFPNYDAFETNLIVKDGGERIAFNPDEMAKLRTFLDAHTVRRRKEQVGIQMPAVIYSTVMVPMTDEQRRIYKRVEREMKMELADGTIKTIVGALPKIMRLKQACFSPELFGGSEHSAKIEQLRDIVTELVASGEKAIIFTQFEPGVRILAREFEEYDPAVITGKLNHTTKRRDAQVEKFETSDDCKLFIGTIRANQEAITLSAATYVIMLDEEWSPNSNDQAIARSAAGGLRGINADHVNVIKLQCENSIEQDIEALNDWKRAVFDRTIERDGGRLREVRKVTLADIRKVLNGEYRDKKPKVAA